MTEFFDLLSRVPVGVVAIAIAAALSAAGLVVLAFCSIPERPEDIEWEFDDYSEGVR